MPLISFRRFFVTLICLLWSGALALRAADRYVATNGTDTGTCETWGTAASNIQYAVDLAIVGETVWVSNGSYCVTNQITITNNITVKSTNGYSSTLVYADWPLWTTRCFSVSRTGIVDGFTISNGHYWTSNDYTGGGGAVLATGTIRNCYFTRNVCSNMGIAAGGGGVYIVGNGTVSDCTFITNVVFSSQICGGGAIGILTNGYVLNCVIISNRAAGSGRGGGIAKRQFDSLTVSDSAYQLVISNCTISMNIAGDAGSGIYLSGGFITDCLISNNYTPSAGGGGSPVDLRSGCKMRNCVIANNRNTGLARGAVFLQQHDSMSNCTIIGNGDAGGAALRGSGTGEDYGIIDGCIFSNNYNNNVGTYYTLGGGVGITNGILRNSLLHHNTNTHNSCGGAVTMNGGPTNQDLGVFNCTIVDNYSGHEGGGILMRSGTDAVMNRTNTVRNCIIANNRSYSNNYPDAFNMEASGTNNYFYSCILTSAPLAPDHGNITSSPMFVNTNAGNWRLAANSPCINKGTNISWMTNSYDLDGRTRIRYGTVDMGAYEFIYEGTIYKLW